jgi:two-component system, cell cycle sensor histidine kinase and response regulator CckA
MMRNPTSPAAANTPDVMTDQQFRRFAGSLSHVVWRMSVDGGSLIAPRLAELTGLTERQLHQSGWLEAVHPEDRAEVAKSLRSALGYRTHFEADFRLRLRDRTYHWYRMRGEPLLHDTGVLGWLGVASNVDAQKRAEELLRENEARLRTVIRAARVGSIDHDLVTGAIKAGPVALALLGYDENTTITYPMVIERIHPDDRASFASTVKRATAAGASGEIEEVFRACRPDGSEIWVSVRGTYEFQGTGPDRRAVRFVGVCGDVTGKIRDLSERALMSAIVSSSDDAMIATTLAGIVTHWNAAAERMFGYSAAEMVGESTLRFIPPDLLDQYRVNSHKIIADERFVGHETERLTRSGKRLRVSQSGSLVRDEAGVSRGISIIVRDISQQKRLEAEVAQAQKMEAVGQLAGGIAHDLNNILTAILVGVEFAVQTPSLDPESAEAFTEVRHECFRAAGLIRQLLAIGKRQVINPRPCDVNEILDNLQPMLKRLMGEDVQIAISSEATRGIFADPAQIDQVLLNLAVNARDAMRAGGTLRVESFDDPGSDRVIVRVSDTGSGMTSEVKSHLFEPFFTTKPVAEGTGLGLSTSYGIVAQSGGTISVDTELGVGSRFTIALPASEIPAAVLTLHPAPALCTGDETVLVVEDDRVVREQVVRGLIRAGFHVLEAQNGEDALSVLGKHRAPVHLVLTDVVMPEMSGGELIDRLRGWFPRLRVLFMSGYSDRAVINQGAVAPDTELIQKPFELSALTARVRQVLDAPMPSAALSLART